MPTPLPTPTPPQKPTQPGSGNQPPTPGVSGPTPITPPVNNSTITAPPANSGSSSPPVTPVPQTVPSPAPSSSPQTSPQKPIPTLVLKSADTEGKATRIPSGPISKLPDAPTSPSAPPTAPVPPKAPTPIMPKPVVPPAAPITSPTPPPPPTLQPPVKPLITNPPKPPAPPSSPPATPSSPQATNRVAQPQVISGSAKIVPLPTNLPPHRPMPGAPNVGNVGTAAPAIPPAPVVNPAPSPVLTRPGTPTPPIASAMPAVPPTRPSAVPVPHPLSPPKPGMVVPAPMPAAPLNAASPAAAPLPSPAMVSTSTSTTNTNVKPAVAKKSILRFLPFIVGGLALLGVIGFILMKVLGLGSQPTPVAPGASPTTTVVPGETTTLTYWGLWESDPVMAGVFKDFEAANPGITVNYIQQNDTDYRERLQTAIAQGSGPDLFRFHATWTPMLRDDLASVPSTVFTPASFQSTFYPVAVQQLTSSGQIKGIPLMYDGLGLYYNTDILKSADAQPPTTWADLRILASQLTVTSGSKVQRAGLAIGNATNVEHFSDILGLLMLQNGADLTNPTTPEAKEALIFYTDFLKTYKVWSDDLPNSTVAFARGDVAMMFAPSWRAHEITAQNPNLHFAIAPVPKLGTSQVAWATYWAEGVNAKSKNQTAAWKLLAYLSQPDVMKKMYSDQSGTRQFGELYSRRDLANDLATQPLAQPFLADAPNAKGGPMSSFTHDSGINDQIIKYYQDAVTAVLNGTDAGTALQTVSQGVAQVLGQYGVATTQPVAPVTTNSSTTL